MKYALFLVLMMLVFFSACVSVPYVCTKDTCYEVEIANSPDERSLGLMNRPHLEEDKGMLFIFEEPKKHYFWMKNTLIPLDIIWLNQNQEIIYVNENTPPCVTQTCESYGPDEDSKYVLEINGGEFQKQNMNLGQVLTIIR